MSHKLEYLKQKYGNLPLQQSKAWIEGRKYAFGGSEIYNYFNKDKESYNKLVYKKLYDKFEGNDYTNWGKLFEPVAKKIINDLDKLQIEEFGAVPHSKYPICYSPDGLIIENNELHLLEIKCPIIRDIGNNIPIQYKYQINTGMSIFPVQDCYYYEFKFRRCGMWCLNKSVHYDRIYHKESKKRSEPTAPLLCGYLYWNNDLDLIDLSKYENMLEILKKYKCEDIKPNIQIGGYFESKKGIVLKFKLFGYTKTIFSAEKSDEWMNENSKGIWDLYKIIYEENKKNKDLQTS